MIKSVFCLVLDDVQEMRHFVLVWQQFVFNSCNGQATTIFIFIALFYCILQIIIHINIFFIGHFYIVQSWPILTNAYQISTFCELFCPLLGYICSWHPQLWQRSDVKKYSKFAGFSKRLTIICVNNIVSQFVLQLCASIFVPPFLNMKVVLQFAGRCRYI